MNKSIGNKCWVLGSECWIFWKFAYIKTICICSSIPPLPAKNDGARGPANLLLKFAGTAQLRLLQICWYKNHLFQHSSTSSKKWWSSRPSKSVAEICWVCACWVCWKFADIKTICSSIPALPAKNEGAWGPANLLLKFAETAYRQSLESL